MKQIRIFNNANKFCLVTEVNDFIKNNKVKINDIQYSSNGGSIISSTQYSVMIVIEEDEI
ncbi:hypothetical protein [Clostridium estertheticum]|uniref:Sporulation protein Cse60 n=1 Tax=Clostridium estertheticum TaxID=238834 RepID=A0AA47IA86_9CLOT|nr:hypothetical protein [Clostridium estertheticum]MBU3157632.1 hypothetical protein [Clostridium estertheticum]WAG63249.1 hypothetical protein LL038_24800 [Clostridium estertheticum]